MLLFRPSPKIEDGKSYNDRGTEEIISAYVWMCGMYLQGVDGIRARHRQVAKKSPRDFIFLDIIIKFIIRIV